jgi:hypothetical protein
VPHGRERNDGSSSSESARRTRHTLDLFERTRLSVLLVDRCPPDEVDGMARAVFGGMFMGGRALS